MKKKIIICSTIVIILALCAVGCYFLFGNKEETSPLPEVKAVDNIEKFGYTLYDSKTELYKTYFNQLKDTLNQENIDEEKYAEIIAELFVIDFYTLNNKVTNTDIGGIDFIHEEARETFKLAAKDTIYKYVESNVYGERTQKLPEVSEVALVNISNSKFEGEKVTDENSYNVILGVTYKEDLGYPINVILTLVHVENKLYIVEVK